MITLEKKKVQMLKTLNFYLSIKWLCFFYYIQVLSKLLVHQTLIKKFCLSILSILNLNKKKKKKTDGEVI